MATETIDSNGVYREYPTPILATTHPVPALLQDAHARAADASSSAIIVSVSLRIPAEVHYAVFPTIPEGVTKEAEGQSKGPFGVEGARHSEGLFGTEHASANVAFGDIGEGKEAYVSWGCGNATATARGGIALNGTRGLVTSGAVSSATSAASNEDRKPVPAVAVAGANAIAATSQVSKTQQAFSEGGEGMKVVFRVEGLKAAEAYNVCIFTETPGSNGYVRAVLAWDGVRMSSVIACLGQFTIDSAYLSRRGTAVLGGGGGIICCVLESFDH